MQEYLTFNFIDYCATNQRNKEIKQRDKGSS